MYKSISRIPLEGYLKAFFLRCCCRDTSKHNWPISRSITSSILQFKEEYLSNPTCYDYHSSKWDPEWPQHWWDIPINNKGIYIRHSDIPIFAGNGTVTVPTVPNGISNKEDSHANSPNSPSPIAIVGMAMRLPGGVRTADEFWDMLVNKKEGHCPVPENRYNIKEWYHPSGRPGTLASTHGHFIHQDLGHFDREFFFQCLQMTLQRLTLSNVFYSR